ncbi:MAG: hypothetical protein ABI355_07535 [Solirubrobacteraceae bacterium]
MGSAQSSATGSLVRTLGQWARGNTYTYTYTVRADPREWQRGGAPAVSAPETNADLVTAQVR